MMGWSIDKANNYHKKLQKRLIARDRRYTYLVRVNGCCTDKNKEDPLFGQKNGNIKMANL